MILTILTKDKESKIRKKRTFMKMVTMGLVMAIIMLSIPVRMEAYTGKKGVRVIVEKSGQAV